MSRGTARAARVAVVAPGCALLAACVTVSGAFAPRRGWCATAVPGSNAVRAAAHALPWAHVPPPGPGAAWEPLRRPPGIAPVTTAAPHHVLTPAAALAGPRILYAPAEPDDPDLRAAVAALTNGTVDYFDARADTPGASLLNAYDCVFTWPDEAYFDPQRFGDRLAEFVNSGGRVVLGAFSTFTSGSALGGRIMTPAYCPVTSPLGTGHFEVSDSQRDGISCLYAGVGRFGFEYRDVLALQGAGVADGHYADGEIAAAYRPDFHVIYLNGTLVGSPPAPALDEWPRLIANACTCPGPGPPAPPARPAMYGASGDGQLFSLDVTSGAGTWVGQLPTYAPAAGIGDIAHDRVTNAAWLSDAGGSGLARGFDIATGAATGAPVATGAVFQALAFVDQTLHGAALPSMPAPRAGSRMLYAVSDDDDPAFRAAIAAATSGTVDYFDARNATPTPTQLAGYDAVYTYINFALADPQLFGDRLADFVDAGGRVLLGPFCAASSGNALAGRITLAGYSPVATFGRGNHLACDTWALDGDSACALAGVTGLGAFYRDSLGTQGGGIGGAHFTDGEIAVAWRPDLGVFYLNGTGAVWLTSGGCPAGAWARVIANAVMCPSQQPAGTLRTLDPGSGTSTVIGATNVAPIVGLAWDATSSTLYGVTGFEPDHDSRLVTLDRVTGHATVVGPTGFDAASLSFGPEGVLYGGGSLFDGGGLHRIDATTGASTLVGATGFSSVPGLTLVRAAPGTGVPDRTTGQGLTIAAVNPARGAPVVRFSLPAAAPARLELLGVDGRRVCARDLPAPAAGPHTVRLDEGAHLPPGIYLARIVQGARAGSVRVVLLGAGW
jgi:hypothetical protein